MLYNNFNNDYMISKDKKQGNHADFVYTVIQNGLRGLEIFEAFKIL